MSPREVKQFAQTCSCAACQQIARQDLYVGRPARTGTFEEIKTRFDGKPCQSCGEPIPLGTTVHWIRGEGVYHPACRS